MVFQPTCVLRGGDALWLTHFFHCMFLWTGFISFRRDTIKCLHRGEHRRIRGYEVAVMKRSWKHSRDVCQASVWRSPRATTVLRTPLLPPTSFFHHPRIFLSFHLITQNSPFEFFLLSSHVCACSPPLPPLVFLLPALRLWCWQIRSLRAAYSSAPTREPATRSTVSRSTSSAFCSTPLKRTGPWPTVTTRRYVLFAWSHLLYCSCYNWLHVLRVIASFVSLNRTCSCIHSRWLADGKAFTQLEYEIGWNSKKVVW